MENEIKVEFYFMDDGFCHSTFRSINKSGKRKYFNRMDSGVWYHVYPADENDPSYYWENDGIVSPSVIFDVMDSKTGKTIIKESNGTFAPIVDNRQLFKHLSWLSYE